MSDADRDAHKNVGFSISSTPEKTGFTAGKGQSKSPKANFPFRIIHVSDLTPDQTEIDWEGGKHLTSVDVNSFASFLQDKAPTLHLDVENRLQESPSTIEVSLQIRGLKDFRPEGLVRIVPELSALWQIRSSILAVAEGRKSREEFREELSGVGVDSEWSEKLFGALTSEDTSPRSERSDAEDGNGALEGILNLVDIDAGSAGQRAEGGGNGSAKGSPEQLVRALASAIGSTGPSGIPGARRLVADIESRVGEQVEAILASEELRGLESRWRGLKLLVDSVDFRSGVQLEVLCVGDEDLAEALHYQVVMPEHQGGSRTPASLVVIDREFGYGSRDIEALIDLAEVAESIQTPAVAAVGAGFFGFESAEELRDVPVVRQHLERPEYIEWSRVPTTAGSAHLSVATPPVLLREATGDTGDPLWGSASIAVAAIAARRYTETGWPTGLTGPGDHQIEERPLWTSEDGPIPVSAVFNTEKQAQLGDAGFTVVGSVPGEDRLFLQTAPTASRLLKFDDEETNRRAEALRSLEAQLFISRIAHFLIAEQGAMPEGVPVSVVRGKIESRLRSLLGVAGRDDAGSYAEVTVDEGDGDYIPTRLVISVQSPPHILPGEVSFAAAIPVLG